MANDMNQVILIGRLTRDSELKYTSGGMAISKLSLAVGRKQKKGEQWVDETSFFDVSIFGKTAEALNKYLLKGVQIAVSGELRQDRWEKEGQKHSAVKILGNAVQLLSKAQGHPIQNSVPKSNAQSTMNENTGFDDIPF